MKPVLTNKELTDLIKDYQKTTNDKLKDAYATVIIESQEGLIRAFIRKYFSTYTASNDLYDEMIQAGRIGIFKGLANYDVTRSKFSTFMTMYIRGEINRVLSENGKTTNHYYYNSREIEKARERLAEKGIDNPTIAELSSETGISPSTIVSTFSSESVSHTCGLEEAYNVPSTGSMKSIEEEADENLTREILIKAINKLPTEHRFVIVRAYGLYNGKTYRDTAIAAMGKHYGLDTAKVKRLKTEALKWLRRDYDLIRLHSQDFLAEDEADEDCFLYLSEELFNGELEKLESIEAEDADFDMRCELISSSAFEH